MLKYIIKRIKRRRPFAVYGNDGRLYRFKSIADAYRFVAK